MAERNPLLQAIKASYYKSDEVGRTQTEWLRDVQAQSRSDGVIEPWRFVNVTTAGVTPEQEKQAVAVLDRLINPRIKKWFVFVLYDYSLGEQFEFDTEAEARECVTRCSGADDRVWIIEGWNRS